MNPSWKTFLIENGAIFANEQLVSFANPKTEFYALNKGSVLTSLSDHGLIEVHGEDAESFLQNQFTNDISNITDSNHQENAWCSPKGRIIANFRIFKRQDRFYLSLSHDLLEVVIKKLRMYVMMSKVIIEDVSSTLIHLSYAGKNAKNELEEIGLAAPSEVGQLSQQNNSSLSILKIAGETPHFEIIGDLNDTKNLWDKCTQTKKATAVAINAWHYLNIQAGTPFITLASSESWIPQMVNYIAVGGVDFKKGCYPGQEVVARLNYLGKTKRRLYHLLLDTDKSPNIGDSIASDKDKKAGGILNLATNLDGKIEALAVLKISEASSNLTLTDDENSSVTLLDLPYSVDDE